MTQKEDYSSVGDHNLKIVEKADNFTNWMYEQIKPFLKGNILEVGSGTGTYSKKIVGDFKKSKIFLSDIDQKYVENLEKEFKNQNVSTLKLDLNKKSDFKKINGKIDSVFALNVLEHVEKDVNALNNIYNSLRSGGTFIILVPAHMFLYNCIDKAINHYRRYNKKLIKEKVGKTKFKIKKMFYFNTLSILGWYVNGNILKNEKINENAMGFFNGLVPFLRIFEKYILRKKVGISLITILEK